MRAVFALAAGAAVVVTAGVANHVRAMNASPRCSVAAVTQRSNQDPAAVAAYWTADQIAQAQRNMRNATAAGPSGNGSCRSTP